jgi:nitrite reductase (NADH) large subunit
MSREKLVIIGAGMAAGRLLDHLTEAAPDHFDITLFNSEPRGSYNRILLSPVLAGDKAYADIITHSSEWYCNNNITTRFGEHVTQIDRSAKTVHTDHGAVPYDKLVLATGSEPVILPLPSHDLKGVISYRDLEDTMTMANQPKGSKAVVIGGGLLGLEAAAGMAARGIEVTVVHLMDHLMERQLDAEAAGLLRSSLEAKGITIRCAAHSEAILGRDGHVAALKLGDGTELPCDLLVMAVGIRPAMSLGQSAGLSTDRAIVVDDHMQTSDPDIFAVGECVQHNGATFGLVAPLFDQASVLAETLLGRSAAFVQNSLFTKLKVTGCDLFSAGDFAEADDREYITYRDPSAGIYKRLTVEQDRLIGVVMYGDTVHGPWFFDLIQNGKDISQMRDTLIFGPIYAQDGDPPEDPLLAVVALPPRACCNGLTQDLMRRAA